MANNVVAAATDNVSTMEAMCQYITKYKRWLTRGHRLTVGYLVDSLTWEDTKTQEWDGVTQERALERVQMEQLAQRTQIHVRNLANAKDHMTNIVTLYAKPFFHLSYLHI